jgi:flagellar hook-associated protein 2
LSSTSIGGSILSGSQSTTSSGGLGSGIDVSELVNAALANQDAELTVLQNQQTALTAQQTALSSISTDIQALQTASFALTDPGSALTSALATSSNTSALNATAIGGTTSGTHTIAITNLATTSSEYSSAAATSSTAIGTGTLTIQVGSNAASTITVDSSNNTLDGLAQSINNANIGVSATVINDASGARLAISSNTSGAPGDLTITSSTGLPQFTKAVTGINAALTVDGIPISSTTNTVSGAINGVTLNLESPTAAGSPVTLSIGPDVGTQEAAVSSFVSAYNTVAADLNTQFTVPSGTSQAGPLASDSTIALAQNEILSATSFATSGASTINSLADLGISLNDDGTLSVNTSQLSNALQSNSTAVQSFFDSTKTGSFGANLATTLTSLVDPITGSIIQDGNGLTQTQSGLTSQISDFQAQIATSQTALTAQYDQVDDTLQELPLLLSQINSQLGSLNS